MTDGVVLRAAVPGDAEAIAAISVRGWAHAYAEFLDPRVLAGRTVEGQTERWHEWLAGDDTRTVVAHVAGRIAGYATVGASRDADATPAVGELAGLYVDPPAQGAGVGTVLLADAVARLRGGFTSATLWVFEENGLGRAFYERHGWSPDPGNRSAKSISQAGSAPL